MESLAQWTMRIRPYRQGRDLYPCKRHVRVIAYRKNCFERKEFLMRQLQLIAHGETSDVIELNTI
jgi:hypothetical protein